MKPCFVIFLLVLCDVRISLSETVKVPIKSHLIMTKDITENDVKSIYDNDMSTVGSFYYSSEKHVTVDFDLGGNYLIEKIVATIKSDSPDIRFIVGNLVNGQGGLTYNCSKKINSINVYECIPKCRANNPNRNGIIARKLLMIFLVKSNWASIYELEVHTKPKSMKSNFISDNRLVLPDACDDQSWLLTNPLLSINKGNTYKKGKQIFLEKNYIINEINVKFEGKLPEDLKIQLSNGEKKQVDIIIDLTKCTSVDSKFTCKLNRPTFPTRVVTINTDGVSQLFLLGQTVFYPTLNVKTSNNVKENLMLSCNINPCDLSVHSNCSENAIKSGVQFSCSNKRLLRMPSGSDLNSFVIINQGEVSKMWSKTKFIVKSNKGKTMVVSMPRSYQYFGQYQCSCLVTDELNTDIISPSTTLSETDFLEKVVFKTDIFYKLEENDKDFKNVTDNLLILRQKTLKNPFIATKIVAYSLANSVNVNVSIPLASGENEIFIVDTPTTETIKAFDGNSDSWSVNIHKYLVEDMFPEFVHKNGLKINYDLKKHNLRQEILVQFFKITEENIEKAEFIQFITDKLISVKLIYAGKKSIKLSVMEKTCIKSDYQELAKIEKNQCTSSNAQVVCSNPDDVSLVSITKDRNIATKYIYSIQDAANETLHSIVINNTVVLNQKDVNFQMKYVDINSDPKNPSVTKVNVEIKFISKIINDFIPCGKVLLTIQEPQKNIKKMILQESQLTIPVDLNTNSVDVSLNLEIEGINGKYSTVLTVVNPTSFLPTNIKISNDTKLVLSWNGIDKVNDDLLVGYEINTKTTILACKSMEPKSFTVNKTENQNFYRMELDSLSTEHSSKLVVSVQAIFKNKVKNFKGQKQEVELLSTNINSSKVRFNINVFPKQKSITIIPSESNIPCGVENVEFTLKSDEVVHVVKDIKKIDNLKYSINNLIPGRKYKLTAQVRYNSELTDKISEIYIFETADDISISQSKHIAQVNDDVNITCNADVGPMDEFQKKIEWRRADNSPLPDGVRSVTYPNIPGSAFLIMKNALADYSSDYGCFVKPAAKVGRANINIIINDLVVKPVKKQVDFSKTVDSLSITCYSSTLGDGNLQWSDSNNLPISEKENDKFKIAQTISKEKSVTSVLTIKTPSIEASGTYKCLKSISQIKAFQEFTLYGEEKLDIFVEKRSDFVGEITKLQCKGQLATKDQKVVWEFNSILDNNKKIVKTFYPDSKDYSIQNIEIINNLALHQVSCKIVPSYEKGKTPLTKTHSISLKSKINIEGPLNATTGSNVSLTCIGHPTNAATNLQWVFHNKTSGNSTEGAVILSSKNLQNTKSFEPIKLVLTLKNVKDKETGRYECKFTTKSRSEYLTSKSTNLFVESSNFALSNTNACSDCPNKGAYRIFNSYLSRAIYMSVIAKALFCLL